MCTELVYYPCGDQNRLIAKLFHGIGGVRMTHTTSIAGNFFQKKVAIVTGGAQGIGFAVADRLCDLGAFVYILDKSIVKTNSERSHSIVCDLTSEDSVISAFNSISMKSPKIDIVCANAGIVPEWATTESIDLASWNEAFAINSTGLMLTIKHSVPLFGTGSGAIVVTGSINSWKGDPNIAAYVASKHAALGIIRATAMDLGSKGIRVNGVGPGPIATDALLSRISNRKGITGLSATVTLENLAKATALHRIATVEDVVSTIIFLASDASAGITGQLIPVDCGVF